MQHALLTRFNLPTPGHEGFIRATPRWLEDRFQLFEQYCLPSVASQTCKDFRWIIYFDPQTPDWAREKIDTYERQNLFQPIFRETVPKPVLLSDIATVFESTGGKLLTTSLDNDDMIAKSFMQRLQEAAVAGGEERRIYNFPLGYTYAERRLYRHRDMSNAFASMCEPWSGALTIWHDWHTRLKHYGPIIQLASGPAWIQVIHGRNVSNRVRGWLVEPSGATQKFALPAGEVPPQTISARIGDRIRFLVVRQPREAARRAVRAAISTLLPKEYLATVKLWYSRMASLWKGRQ